MRLAYYTNRDLTSLCVKEDQPISYAMQVMSGAGLRLAPVLSSETGLFCAVLADGDIRRHVASGGGMEDAIRLAANYSPRLSDEKTSHSEIRKVMQQRGLEYLPILENGRLSGLYVLWAVSEPSAITAVIMAGGLGSRLAPLTDNCPKPLLKIGHKPILTHIIDHLQSQGVNRFILSVNYLSEMLVDHYGDGSELGASISYAHEDKRLGTGGALGQIDPQALSDPFLCLNGDILNDIDVNALYLEHQERRWNATMVVRDYTHLVPYGVVRTNDVNDFQYAEEKPKLHFKINAGFYMLSKSILSVVPKSEFYDLPTLFDDLVKRGMPCGTFPHKGRWIDVGTVDELKRAQQIFEGV